MGLAMAAAVKGYKTVFVMPDKMSDEKIKALRAFGSRVVITPTNVEPDDPRSYYSVSRRIAEETPNAFYANQYYNPSNPESHYLTTGPEIWEQTNGEIDVFVAGLGTGGTISGTGKYLKEQKPELKCVGGDPIGSVYYDLKRTGKMTEAFAYKVEGVGEDILPGTIDLELVDEVVQVTDRESFHANRDLARLEGVLTGGSGGLAVMAAIKYAEKTQKKENILVLMPDSAMRYLTKQFNDTWMLENGFLGPEPGNDTVAELLNGRDDEVLSVSAQQSVSDAVALMRAHDISQAPVLDGRTLIGVIDESNLLDHLLGGGDTGTVVGELATQSFATAEKSTPLTALAPQLKNNKVVLAMNNGEVIGVISQIDLIERMAKD